MFVFIRNRQYKCEYSEFYMRIVLAVNIFSNHICLRTTKYSQKEKTAVPNRTAEDKFNSYL